MQYTLVAVPGEGGKALRDAVTKTLSERYPSLKIETPSFNLNDGIDDRGKKLATLLESLSSQKDVNIIIYAISAGGLIALYALSSLSFTKNNII